MGWKLIEEENTATDKELNIISEFIIREIEKMEQNKIVDINLKIIASNFREKNSFYRSESSAAKEFTDDKAFEKVVDGGE